MNTRDYWVNRFDTLLELLKCAKGDVVAEEFSAKDLIQIKTLLEGAIKE